MNIVFLVHDIHFGGGGERVTANLANHFEKIGYNVRIVSLSNTEKEIAYPINEGIRIDYLNINFNVGSNLVNKCTSIFKIFQHFHKYKSNTIVLCIDNYPSLLLCLLPKWRNLKTVGCQHLAYSGIKNIWALLRRIFFRRLDCVVSLT